MLRHLDRPAHNDIERPAIGHHADIVVEHAPGMEQGDGEAEGFFEDDLGLVDQGVRVGADLVVEFVFAEGKHGDEIRAGADGELDEAFSLFQDEAEGVGLGV